MGNKYQNIFEVLQHVASYPCVRINAQNGKLHFLLPIQSKNEVAYLAQRGCVADKHGTYTIDVGVNENSKYQEWTRGVSV